MTRELKHVGAALAAEALVVAALLTLALDIRAHARVQDAGGVNIWGYRGPVAHQPQPNEIRIVIVGGTRAFGWGGPASALPSVLRQIIMVTTDRPGRPLRPVVVTNLARMGALPDSYAPALEHFAYLRPDYVCVYDDLGERGAGFVEHASGILHLTGYTPILPLVLREKGMVWRYGDVSRGYVPASARTTSGPSALRRAAGATLMRTGAALATLDRSLARAMTRTASEPDESVAAYVDQMTASLDTARRHARGVVLALSPAETARQVERRAALLARLAERKQAEWLRIVDLSADTTLTDPAMRIDGWNYTSAGLTRTGTRIAPALLDLIASN